MSSDEILEKKFGLTAGKMGKRPEPKHGACGVGHGARGTGHGTGYLLDSAL